MRKKAWQKHLEKWIAWEKEQKEKGVINHGHITIGIDGRGILVIGKEGFQLTKKTVLELYEYIYATRFLGAGDHEFYLKKECYTETQKSTTNMQILVLQKDNGDTIEEYILNHDINAPTPENVVHTCEEITKEQAKKTGESIVHDGIVQAWVGIGWVKDRPALVSDYKRYKVIL